MKILLVENKGYNWTDKDGVFFKGYFQYDNNLKVYRGYDAINELKNIETKTGLIDFCRKCDGVFAIIIPKKEDNSVLVATDRARSLPIFYGCDCVSDSAEAIRESLGIPKDRINESSYLEFMSNDYLFGHKTMYSEIGQLDLGEVGEITASGTHLEKYYYHLSPVKKDDKKIIKERLTNASYSAFRRIKEAIGDRQVVLSMSGGYDSRFVGCMLKNVGVENVLCYTYGKKESFEVKQSKHNAEALGYKWVFVEYTDDAVKGCLDEVGLEFINSFHGHDYTMYLQNFPAVRFLVENNMIDENAVFLTGLCGDMPTGNYIQPFEETKQYNDEAVANRLYNLLFTRYEMDDSFKDEWLKWIKEDIKSLPIKVRDYQSFVSAVDCIYTGTCHAHCFLHMNSVHSFFGHEWLLPYWDKELLNTWYSIPAEYRIKQGLYEEWLLGDICEPYGIGTKKIRATYSTNPTIRKFKYFVGSIIAFIFYNLGIVFRRDIDYSNFAPLELLFFKKLKTKKYIKYKKAGILLLQTQYVLQNNYGIDNLRRLYKRIKN